MDSNDAHSNLREGVPRAGKSGEEIRFAGSLRYTLAILSVGVALGVGLLLQNFHFRVPAATLMLFAVAIVSWNAGRGPAVLAVILATTSCYYFFVEPVRTIYINPSEIPFFIIFAAFAVLLCWFGTVRRRIEADLRQSRDGLYRLNRELRAIRSCNQVLLRATDEQSLLNEICRIICEEAGYRMAWVAYAEHDEAKTVRPVAWSGTEAGYLEAAGITWADTERGGGPTGTAIRSGTSCCVQDFASEPRITPWRESVLQRGIRSGIALPIKNEHADTFGCLSIYSAQPNAFTPGEIRLLEELADDLAFGIVTLRSHAAHKRAEQQITLLSFALDKIREAAFLIDDTGRFHYVNEEVCRVLGYSRAELLAMGVPDIDPEFPPERWSDHWRDLTAQRSLSFESRHRTRDGRIFPVEVSANYFEYEGQAYNLALARDITERKKAEEALRRSEAYLAEAQRLTHTGAWANDVTPQPVYWSEELFRIWGFDPQRGLPTWDQVLQRIHPEDLDKYRQYWQSVLRPNQEKVHSGLEIRIVLPDGTVKHLYGLPHRVLNANGELVEVVGTTVDITDRKRAEEALRQSEAYLAEAQRLSHTGSWAFYVGSNKYIYLSEECSRIFELDEQEVFSREAISRRIHPEDWDRVNEAFEKSLRDKADTSSEFRLVLPSGTVKHILVTRHPVLNDAGDVVQLIGTAVDITERKRAEEERRQSAERFRAIADYTYDWESWIGVDGKLLWVNPAVERITGYSVGECMVMLDFPIPIVAEADREAVARQIGEAVQGSSRNDFEFRVRHKDGHLVWVAASWQPIYDSRGARLGHRSSIRDIAERKQAENALRRSETYLAEAQRLSHSGSWALDVASGKYLYVSEEFCRIFGLDAQEGLPSREDFSRHIHPEDWDRANGSFEKQLREKVDMTIEYRIVLPSGTVKHIQAIRHPVLSEAGEVVQLVGTVIDITEWKRAEAALRESEERYRTLFEKANDAIFLENERDEIVEVNQRACALLGYSRDELLSMKVPDLQAPEVRGQVGSVVGDEIEKYGGAAFETMDLHRSGRRIAVEVNNTPIVHQGQKLVLSIVRDITDRKRAEEERQRHLWFLESMDRVNRAMQGSNDVEQVMSNVLEVVLSIFGSDRAWLVYPCDPQAPTWRVAMEHTRPEYPGAFVLGLDLPVDPDVARVFETARSSGGAVRFGPGADQPVPAELAERFKIQAMIAMVVPPKLGQPYLFGLHQCSYPRAWTPQEERLFQEIGRRLTDALTSVLIFRSLRESERRLEEAQRIAHVGYWDRDLDAGRITLSHEGCRIFGFPPEERIFDLPAWHERWQTLIHPEDRPRAAAAAAAALAGGPRYDVEYRVVHRTGEVRTVHSQGDVIRDASGRPIRMFGIMQDITERKQAEAELRASEERFRTLVQFSFDVYWETDAEHRFTRQEFAEGLADAPAPGSEIGKRRWEIPYLEPDEAAWREHRATMDAHLPFRDFELARPAPGSGKRYVSVSGMPVFDETGRFLGYRGVGRHITERKRAEQALRQSEAYLAEAERLSHTGSWAFDVASNKYVYASEECGRIFELEAQEEWPTRGALSRLIHPEDWPRVNEAFEKSLRDKVDTSSEFRITLRSGTVKHVHAIRHPVLNDAGDVVKLVGTVMDITERKRAEEERERLRQLEAELAHINRVSLMGELASSIAHEVNQPLSGVVSNANACLRWLAGDAPNLEEVRETARRILRDGKRAAEVIARIRALAKRAETPQERLDLNETMREVLVLLGDEAKRKGARIHTDFAEDLAPVAGDQVQLQQVVLNLVMNGIEAMSSGGERARELGITTRNLDPDQVQVTVEDSGTGLDPNALDKIFDPFYTTKPTGMGMGLSICRSILEAHGGRLWATAKDGPGAVFHFTLPRYHEEASNA